jgi:hypothetical protein
MINVSNVVNSPRMAQPFTILRGPGSWLNGVWIPTATPIDGFGVVSVAQPRDIEMIPEGDRVTGMMVFHSECPIYGTHANSAGQGASSDIVVWRSQNFRILFVYPFEDYGYFRAIGTRMKAA